jgi:hypothetical protein
MPTAVGIHAFRPRNKAMDALARHDDCPSVPMGQQQRRLR